MKFLVVGVLVMMVSGCFGPDGGDSLAPGLVVDDESNRGPVWVFDANGTLLPNEAFPFEIPAFDLRQVGDHRNGEPTIGITRTGAIFTPALHERALPVTGAATSHYMRSTDGGSTWMEKSPHVAGTKTHTHSGDPWLHADPTTGRIWAADTSGAMCNTVSWSDDDGETWITHPHACLPGVNDRPILFTGPATPLTLTAVYPNQVYMCTNGVPETKCYQSPDGGITWLRFVPAFAGVDTRYGVHGTCNYSPSDAAASWHDGTVYLARAWCGEPTLAVSDDDGITFRHSVISDRYEHRAAESYEMAVATDLAGNVYALWPGNGLHPPQETMLYQEGGPYGGRAMYLAVSRDQGRTWSEPVNVTAPGVTAVKFPAVVAGEDGRIAFAYVGSDNPLGWNVERCEYIGEPEPVAYTQVCEIPDQDVYENATWNGYVGFSLNATSPDSAYAVTMVNPIEEPLKRGTCPGRCEGDEGAMMDFIDISIDPMTGQVFAAFVDVCSGDCDGLGKKTSEVYQKSVGVVAVQTAGPYLLDEPIPERSRTELVLKIAAEAMS